jgi:hypothetical protein
MIKDLYLIFSQIFLGIITTLKFGYEQESLQTKKKQNICEHQCWFFSIWRWSQGGEHP